jgi:hypothetical protein
VTIPVEFMAPVTAPMYAMLEHALSPYEGGDLDATGDLIGDLLDVIGAAEPTTGLITSLKALIHTLPPSEDVLAKMHDAIGTAMDFTPRKILTPANGSGIGTPGAAPARTGYSPKKDSVADLCMAIMAERPGEALRTQDFVNELRAQGRTQTGGGAVGAAFNTLTGNGLAVLVSTGSPQRFMRADDPALPQQFADATANEADPAPATEPADPDKTVTAARRGAAKSGK